MPPINSSSTASNSFHKNLNSHFNSYKAKRRRRRVLLLYKKHHTKDAFSEEIGLVGGYLVVGHGSDHGAGWGKAIGLRDRDGDGELQRGELSGRL